MNEELKEEARSLFERKLGREVDDREADAMLRNLTGFFNLLCEWNHNDQTQ